MLSFRKISAASNGRLLVRYYTEDKPQPIHDPAVSHQGRTLDTGSRLTAYYTGREGRASWRPDMPADFAKAIGIDPRKPPQDEDLARLFEAKRADTGEAWSKGTRTISGFDLVFAPHKSVTLAAEFAATPAESAAIINAVERAGESAMRHVARELGWSRKGAGGKDGAEPGSVGWASFLHYTARPTLHAQDGPDGATYSLDAPVAGDPQLHIHYFLMNAVVGDDGKVGSLMSRALTDANVKMFGAHFQAFLADELRKIGAHVGYDAGEQAVRLLAVPERVIKPFSKRQRDVERQTRAFAEAQGLDWESLPASVKLDVAADAARGGRLGKMKFDEARIWGEQKAALGWEHSTVMERAVHPVLSRDERLDLAYKFAARHLAVEFNTAAVITHEKLGMYAMRGLIGAGFGEGVADMKRVVELLEERGIMFKGEHVALVVGMVHDTVRVANSAQVRIEKALMAQARRAARDMSGALTREDLESAMEASGIRFKPAQRKAVHALGQGGALSMLTGVAGAEVVGRTEQGLLLRTKAGAVAAVAWKGMTDQASGRLKLGHGYALTIDAAQGATNGEVINAMPGGTAGVTGFTSYVAESRHLWVAWTMISEGAVHQAVQRKWAMGDITPVTERDLWDQAAKDMSRKDYKVLTIDLEGKARPLHATATPRASASGSRVRCPCRTASVRTARPGS